jgi:hypothetical protein
MNRYYPPGTAVNNRIGLNGSRGMKPMIEQHLNQVLEIASQFAAAFILLGIAFFCVWLVTVIDIVSSDFKTNADKIIWFFITILIPPIGILLYYFIGRAQKIYSGDENKPYQSGGRFRDIGRDE